MGTSHDLVERLQEESKWAGRYVLHELGDLLEEAAQEIKMLRGLSDAERKAAIQKRLDRERNRTLQEQLRDHAGRGHFVYVGPDCGRARCWVNQSSGLMRRAANKIAELENEVTRRTGIILARK